MLAACSVMVSSITSRPFGVSATRKLLRSAGSRVRSVPGEDLRTPGRSYRIAAGSPLAPGDILAARRLRLIVVR